MTFEVSHLARWEARMGRVLGSEIHLNLQTQNKRKVSKTDKLLAEIARLERANSYIIDEPEQKAYFVRNSNRIKLLQTKIASIAEG